VTADAIRRAIRTLGVGVDVTSGLLEVAARSAGCEARRLSFVVVNLDACLDYMTRDCRSLVLLLTGFDPDQHDLTTVHLVADEFEKLLKDLAAASIFVQRVERGIVHESRANVQAMLSPLAAKCRAIAQRLSGFEWPAVAELVTA
jgi:hypothetical protein